MRVLMICPELPTTTSPGSMAPGARQIQSISQAGWEVEIVDMRGIPKLKYLQVLPRVRRALHRVDLVHAHFGYCGWLALLGSKLSRRRVPIVMSFMGDDLLGTPANEMGRLERSSVVAVRWNLRLAACYDQVIVKSQEMADVLGGVPCHVIPNGVDLDVFQPQARHEARQQLGWPMEGWRVLFPGDPTNPRKGFALAEAAVAVAAARCGQPIELIPLWGIKPDQVATYMNACHAMVMTSLIEGSPNVVKEALACNANVAAVPVGDVAEMLEGIQNCRCAPRDPELLGQELAELLQRAEPSNGRQVIEPRGLSLPGVAGRIISVYEAALAGTSAGGRPSEPRRRSEGHVGEEASR